MIDFLMWALIVLMILVALYFIIDYFYPTFGTVVVNAFFALPFGINEIFEAFKQVATDAQALPWDKVFDTKQVGAIIFAFALANIFFRLRGPKKAVGS